MAQGNKDDFFFGFDTSSFTKAMKEMKAGISGFTQTLTNKVNDASNKSALSFASMAKKTREAFSNIRTDVHYQISAFKYYKNKFFGSNEEKNEKSGNKDESIGIPGITAAIVLSKALLASIKTVFQYIDRAMPEVQQTFSIAGDIFTKNLLFPLRKFLLPYLQKILDWTTHHRADFVRWGSILVSVFRAIKQMAISLWDAFSPIIDRIRSGLSGIFGSTQNSIIQTINLVIFKAVFLFEILMSNVKKFSSNLVSLIDPEVFDKFLTSIKNLLVSIVDLVIDLTGHAGIAGKTLGWEFNFALEAATKLLDTITALINALDRLSKMTASDFASVTSKFVNENSSNPLSGPISKLSTPVTEPIKNLLKTVGEIISPSQGFDPQKRNFGRIEFGDMNITVTEGNAAAAGKAFGRTFADEFRERTMRSGMQRELLSEGRRQ